MSELTSLAELEPSTKIRIEELAFHWEVNMYSLEDQQGSGVSIMSPVFTGGNILKYSWQLEFVSLRRANNTIFNSLKLKLLSVGKSKSSKDGEVQACAFGSYKNNQSQLRAVTGGDHHYEHIKAGSPLKLSIKLDDLYEVGGQYCKNNVLTFQCIIFIDLGIVSRSVLNGADSVVKSLINVLQSGYLSDVQLITPAKTFSAHKLILAAQSPVFDAMFRAGMLEAEQNSVEIEDFDENIVEGMIEFMYSGKTKLSTKLPFCPDLLRIADKYGLLGLKSEIESVLEMSLNEENGVQLLLLAHLHNCNALKMASVDFFNRNKKKMTDTESFKMLAKTHPEILMELYLDN